MYGLEPLVKTNLHDEKVSKGLKASMEANHARHGQHLKGTRASTDMFENAERNDRLSLYFLLPGIKFLWVRFTLPDIVMWIGKVEGAIPSQ